MELSIALEADDRYTPLTLGAGTGAAAVYVAPADGPANVTIHGTPDQLRRLAEALTRAAGA